MVKANDLKVLHMGTLIVMAIGDRALPMTLMARKKSVGSGRVEKGSSSRVKEGGASAVTLASNTSFSVYDVTVSSDLHQTFPHYANTKLKNHSVHLLYNETQ